MRRVVITGLGLVTPLGTGVDNSWSALLAGRSGAGRISAFDPTDYGCQIACEVPRVDGRGGGGVDIVGSFDPNLTMSTRDQRRVDDFILYAMAAADEAVIDSGWHPQTEEDKCRTGVIIGSGIGGLNTIAETALELEAKGPRKISPFFIPSALINLASGQVSIRYGLKGPNHSVVTACATGAHAIGDAMRLIQWGDADVMFAGGAEAAVCKIGVAGFVAARAMSTNFNDRPQMASRPYDKDRDGFVMGEGAGILVLEEYEHAIARGAKIYAEVVGYGFSSNGEHISNPNVEGQVRALNMAMQMGSVKPEEVDYINAHATSTPVGDRCEALAIHQVFGDNGPLVSSTKSITGHECWMAGASEVVYSLLMMQHGFVAPNVNFAEADEDTSKIRIAKTTIEKELNTVVSNSFGFGGTNSTLILKKFNG